MMKRLRKNATSLLQAHRPKPSLGERVKRGFRHLFPERQIFYRARGEVRFFALRPWMQAGLGMVMLGLGGWVGYSSYAVIFRNELLAAREQQIQELTQAYGQLSLELQRTQDYFVSMSGTLEDRYRQLYEMAQEAGLASDNNPIVEQTKEKDGSILQFFSKPWRRSSNEAIDAPDALKEKLAGIRETQDHLAHALRDQAVRGIASMEKIIAMTRLDPDDVVSAARPRAQGQGGPLIRARSRSADAFDQKLADLDETLVRWRVLKSAIKDMPLAAPILTQSRFSSGFGYRRDPFNGHRAFHAGIDFADELGTKIYATGAGVVTFSGRRGPYGRLIEIDHGSGFRTRYAHLNAIHVEAGETVKLGQHIGDMGTTGRSTGVHLHYEILHRGEQVDPLPFIEAGHVLKQQKVAIHDER